MKQEKNILIVLLILFSMNIYSQKSKIWNDFVEKKEKGMETILPDFSYAGYKFSEESIPICDYKIFNVIDFGAGPNDEKSDKSSVQMAIAAAEKNGEGIIFFPKGRYIINDSTDNPETIKISSSNIVFRGEGFDKGGTIIFFEKNLPAKDQHLTLLKPM